MSVIQLSPEEKSAMDALSSALRPFQQLTGGGPLSLFATFITVARKGPITVVEIARQTGSGQSATTRQLQDLSHKNRSGGAGLGLIQQRTEGLFTFSSLTPVGHTLMRKIATAMMAPSGSGRGVMEAGHPLVIGIA